MDYLGATWPRRELLDLADVEEALGDVREAARVTRAAAALMDDEEERQLALEIADARDAAADAARV